jgi:hypothetical protein
MPEDLPIYPDAALRSGLQFADLARFQAIDKTPVWEKSDRFIAQMEGAESVTAARAILERDLPSEQLKAALLQAHGLLFNGRTGAGELRQSTIAVRYRGQDCPEPQYIARSLDNFFSWMTSESVGEIHPIEKAGLALTRTMDIWPFDYGNLTVAVMLANRFLHAAGYPPFFVMPQHLPEFEKIVGQAIVIETQPLVNAIYKTLKREMEALAHEQK